MKPTNDKFFIDSNVALYLIDDFASAKKKIAISIINRIGFISPQVNFLLKSSYAQPEDEETIKAALLIFDKYQLQSYDSKIMVSALQVECATLYSEDMQNEMVIEN